MSAAQMMYFVRSTCMEAISPFTSGETIAKRPPFLDGGRLEF
jgi:hypothetical protein